MRNKFITFIIGAMFLSALNSACKKNESAVVEPSVSVNYNSTQFFGFQDTIFVSGSIEHAKNILKVSIGVVDKKLNSLLPGVVLEPMSPSYPFQSYIVVNNRYISESDNYLLIKVDDGSEIWNFWYPINLSILDKELESVMVVTGISDNRSLWKTSSGNIEKLLAWNSDYIGSAIDSRLRMFYTSGQSSGGIMAFDLAEKVLKWSVPTQFGSSLPTFTSFHGSEDLLSVGLYNGVIESFNGKGSKNMSSDAIPNARSRSILNLDKFVIAAYEIIGGGSSRKLIVYNYPSGVIYTQFEFTGKVIGMIPLEDDEVLLLIENNSSTKSYICNIRQKTLLLLHTVTDQLITNIAGNYDHVFLATENGVMWYRPQIGSVVPYLMVSGVVSMAYNNLDNILYIGYQNRVEAYRLNSTNILSKWDFIDPVIDVKLLYNK